MEKFSLLSLVFVLLFTSGCIRTRDDIQTESDEKMTELQIEGAKEVQIQELQESLREMSGRLESLEMKASKDEQKGASALGQEKDKFKIFEEAIAGLEKQILDLKSEVTALKAEQLRMAQGLKAKKRQVQKKPAAKKVGNYTSAEDAFKKKKWRSAIFGYQKYRELNPRGRRYDVATFKIGVSFKELGMKAEAKSFFEEVVERFPKRSLAKKAKALLKTLK